MSNPTRDPDGQPVEVSLRVSAGELVRDLTVWAPPAATTGEVVDALTAFLSLTPQQSPQQSPQPSPQQSPYGATNGVTHALVDGVQLSGASLWADVAPCTGSVVHLGQDHSPATPGTSQWELAVVSGTLAGTRLPLRDGQSLLGRGSDAALHLPDSQLSRHHLKVALSSSAAALASASESASKSGAGSGRQAAAPGAVVVTDLSSNGTLLDGRLLEEQPCPVSDTSYLTVGTNVVALRRVVPRLGTSRKPGRARRQIQVPPRPAARALPTVVLTQPSEPDPPPPPRLNLIGTLAPLVASLVLAYVYRQPLMLIIAAMSPVVAGATYIGSRRAVRRRRRADLDAYTAELATYVRDVEAARHAEAAVWRDATPDPAVLTAAAAGPTAALWQRRPDDADFAVARCGTRSRDSAIVVRSARGVAVAPPMLPDVPVTLDLREVPVLGVAGDPDFRDGFLRALLLQLLVPHSPNDLRVSVITTRPREAFWDPLKWAPHLHNGAVVVATDLASVAAVAADITATATSDSGSGSEASTGTAKPCDVVIVDLATPTDEVAGLLSAIVAAAAANTGPTPRPGGRPSAHPGGAGIIVVVRVADSYSRLPREVRAAVEGNPRTGTARIHTASDDPHEFRPDLIPAAVFDETVRRLGGFVEPTADAPTTARDALPSQIGWLASMGSPGLDVRGVADRWTQRSAVHPIATLGVGPDLGPVEVDLRNGLDGPNAFLGGTTGSGKSDCLRGFLLSLAFHCPPSALSMVLVDFKQGAGLGPLRTLPHVSEFITEHEAVLIPRMLRILGAERRSRQALLTSLGYDSFDQAQDELGLKTPFPRLLVVVDEYAALRQRVPEAVGAFVDVVRQGRAAGMHLLLSTQSISTTVSSDLSDNTTLNICLRVTSEAESRAVLQQKDAAHLPAQPGGRGYARSGSSIRIFQTGWVGHRAPATDPSAGASGVIVTPRRAVRRSTTAAPTGANGVSGDSALAEPKDIDRVVAALRACVADGLASAATRLFSDALPLDLDLDTVPTPTPAGSNATGPADVVLGLLDAPEQKQLLPWHVNLADCGTVAVLGSARSGRTTTLRTLVQALGRDERPCHVYVVDGPGRDLADLANLPHVGAVVPGDDKERLGRLMAVLTTEVSDRQQGRAQQRPAVLLVDRLESLRDDASSATPDLDTMASLTQLVRDGPGVKLYSVLAADSSTLGSKIIEQVQTRLLLNLGGPSISAMAGLPRDQLPTAELPPGRGFWTRADAEVQVGRLAPELSTPDPHDSADPAGGPDLLGLHHTPQWEPAYALTPSGAGAPQLTGYAPGPGEPLVWGVAGAELTPYGLHPAASGFGALVLGPRRSGRSTALSRLATQWTQGAQSSEDGNPRPVLIVADAHSPLLRLATQPNTRILEHDALHLVPGLVADLAPDVLVLVDDADTGDTDPATLEALVTTIGGRATRPGGGLALAGMVVSCGLPDYQLSNAKWFARLRRYKTLLLLQPPPRTDGTWSTLTMQAPPVLTYPAKHPGRGLLTVDGEASWFQVAVDGDPTPPRTLPADPAS